MKLNYQISTLALTMAGFLAVESHLGVANAQIDEIIVTARKREQSLQTVPIAVSAFTGAVLAQSGINDTAELSQMVPNLSIFTANVGLRATLRGQTLNEGLIHEDPSVNLNVDGVYMARPHGSIIPFVDVAQVEVLRGPQGTLFGRNTTGGAINITTKLPEYEWGGLIGGRLANAQRGDLWGSLNIPIIADTLAVRAAVQTQNAGGFDDDKSSQGQSPFDQDDQNFFGSLLWEPTSNIDVVLRGDWSKSRKHYYESTHLINIDPVGAGVGAGRLGATLALDPENVNGYTPATLFAAEGFSNPQGELPIGTTHNDRNNFWSDAAGVSLTTTWELNDYITLKGVASKRWLNQSSLFDLDGTTLTILNTEQLLDHSQTSGEVQAYGEFDLFSRNLEWITGIFYFEEEALQGSTSESFNGFAAAGLAVGPNQIHGIGRNDSIAGFAELDYEVIEDFRITMGGRYTVDNKYAANLNSKGFFATEAEALAARSAGEVAAGQVAANLGSDFMDLFHDNFNTLTQIGKTTSDVWAICRVFPGLQEPAGTCFADNEDTFKAFSWNFGWDWTAWDDGANSALVYANYKRSFRSGGQNFRSAFPGKNSFDPEYVRQIATGLKLDLLDGNLRFNVEGFHQAIADKQVISVIADAAGGLTTLVSNAASANVKGVEFEMNWTPLPNTLEGLQLNGALGWTDPVYNAFPDTQPADPALPFNPVTNPLVAISRQSEPFIRVTELSANASIIYNHAVWDSCDGNLLARLDWSYKSDTPLEDLAEPNPNALGNSVSNGFSTGDYFIVNARSALSLWGGGIEIGVWCKNCTDTQYIQNALDLRDSLGYAVAEPSIPRTFGGDLTYRWGAAK